MCVQHVASRVLILGVHYDEAALFQGYDLLEQRQQRLQFCDLAAFWTLVREASLPKGTFWRRRRCHLNCSPEAYRCPVQCDAPESMRSLAITT